MKEAVVPANGHYVSLFCVESPDVRFEDVVRVPIRGSKTRLPLDATFVDACEEGSIEVAAVTSPTPAVVGARVSGDAHVEVTVQGARPDSVLVTLTGIRSGCRAMRFPVRTERQMHRNNAFWDQARCS